jgi:hypothetical protein
VKIKYIGFKPVKTDNVAGTGATWLGHGDVQEVPDSAAGKLLRFGDVWQRADGDVQLAHAAPATPKAPPPPDHRYVLTGPEGVVVLDDMDDKALRALAKKATLDVDSRIKGDKLRQAIVDAVRAAATQG